MSCSACNCCSAGFQSTVESAILHSSGEPVTTEQCEVITVNSQTGLWANKSESDTFTGPVPLSQYPINNDPCPEVINKVPNCLECHRDVLVKYLEPGSAPEPGPIIINQAQNILCPTAPPVVVRQVPNVPRTPEPLIVREVPPAVPQPPREKIITVPGELLPPPPRKVVIERLPELPDKPQDVHIERWLPFKDVKRQVILNPKPADPVQCKPRNVIVNWQKRKCSQVITEVKNLGVEITDPVAYARDHGCTLLRQCQMPPIAHQVKNEHGQLLACDDNTQYYMELEGDIEGLKLLDLDAEGLGHYAFYVNEEAQVPRAPLTFGCSATCCHAPSSAQLVSSAIHIATPAPTPAAAPAVATSTPATSTPATPAPATSTPATPAPATSTPATPAPATPAPATPAPATPTPVSRPASVVASRPASSVANISRVASPAPTASSRPTSSASNVVSSASASASSASDSASTLATAVPAPASRPASSASGFPGSPAPAAASPAQFASASATASEAAAISPVPSSPVQSSSSFEQSEN